MNPARISENEIATATNICISDTSYYIVF